MKDYLFEIVDEDSELCGEQFFVECDSWEEAWQVVIDNFGKDAMLYHKIEGIGEYSLEEAEILGYDTY